jgi:hypothetical protein
MRNLLSTRLDLGSNARVVSLLEQADTVAVTQFDSSGPQTVVFDKATALCTVLWLSQQFRLGLDPESFGILKGD